MATYRLPLFLQYSRETLKLSDDEWFALTLAVCLGTTDANAIYDAADKLGVLNNVSVAYAGLGGKSPEDAVNIVYDRAVTAGVATWNDKYPKEQGGVPTPFAKIPDNLFQLLKNLPDADDLDFSILALVAAYEYQLNHRRDFVKGAFRFSKKLAMEATASSFEEVEETLNSLVTNEILSVNDGFYHIRKSPIKGARAKLYLDGKEIGRIDNVASGLKYFDPVVKGKFAALE